MDALKPCSAIAPYVAASYVAARNSWRICNRRALYFAEKHIARERGNLLPKTLNSFLWEVFGSSVSSAVAVGPASLFACPSTSGSEEQESQEQRLYHSRVAQEARATE